MAYEKQTWVDGDTITADKLNYMEEGIENAGGYSCTESRQTVFDESITTEADGYPYAMLTSNVPEVNTLIVTFNGTEYSCPKLNDDFGDYAYGAPIVNGDFDFSTYPFRVTYYADENVTYFYTPSSGSYPLKIESAQSGIIYDGSVTTKIVGDYYWSILLIPDVPLIKVTFDNTEYICPQIGRHESADGDSTLYYRYGV